MVVNNYSALSQGLKIEVGHRQLTVDFVNDVALQLAGSDHDDRLHGDKIEYAERLGQMNKRYQMLATDVIDRQKKLEALELQWEEYERGLNNMYSWFEDMGARVEKYSRLGHEMSVRTALKDSQVGGYFQGSLCQRGLFVAFDTLLHSLRWITSKRRTALKPLNILYSDDRNSIKSSEELRYVF